MRKKIISLICVLFVLFLFGFTKSVSASSFSLVAPSGTLTRGQDVSFTVNINTAGSVVTSIQSGMTYDTAYLQYVSAVPGEAMNSITVDTSVGTGKLLFTGTNNTGYNGSGIFATVTFRIIAESPGSTEICTLWTPTITPTTAPTLSCNSACTTSSQCPSDLACYITSGQTTGVCRRSTCTDRVDCICIQPTSSPVATALPQTGGEEPKNFGTLAGGAFILIAGSILFLSNKNKVYHHSHTKTTHNKKV